MDELEAALVVSAEDLCGRSEEMRNDVERQQACQQCEHQGGVPNPLPRDQQDRAHTDQGQEDDRRE